MQSGNALNQWAMRSDHKKIAMTIGEQHNCTESKHFNSSALLKCLNNLPLHDLVEIPSLFTVSIATLNSIIIHKIRVVL